MTRVLRDGVDGLTTLDWDDRDRCRCCELGVGPDDAVTHAGGLAHRDCAGPWCAICDRAEGNTEWSRFVDWRGTKAHAGCAVDFDSDMADDYTLRAAP